MSGVINVGIACDDNYARYAGVVVASILINALPETSLALYILDGGISEENKEKIKSLTSIKPCEINFVPIDESLFEDYKKIKTHSYISIATYYRLKLATLLPNIDKIIYFDCDMVVNRDLSSLFRINIEEAVIAGAQDINFRMLKKNSSYVNAGMVVMDLKKIRDENIEDLFLEYTKAHIDTIKMGDQEILNEVLQGRIKVIDPRWNVQTSNFTNRSIYTKEPWIIHYVGQQKPWKYGNWNYHTEYYYKYLSFTPWKLDEQGLKKLKKSKRIALIKYIQYRPFIFLRPRFYKAIIETYIKPWYENVTRYKRPVIRENTFLIWEPCSYSHAEVVPGYAKYLLDLGYHVSVLLNPDRYDEGLFSRFGHENISYNRLTRSETKKFFKNAKLRKIQGVLVTTVGKLCDRIHYGDVYNCFNKSLSPSKLLLVEHGIKTSVDAGTWQDKIITLRKMDYKGASTTVVNPHYFGHVKITPKNEDITRFITIGAIQSKKKNNELIVNAVKILYDEGYRNFKVTVAGKGSMKGIPDELLPYFDITGRISFSDLYKELEKADFILTSYNEKQHSRYKTWSTSGNFQLVYGFLKPCVITEDFAPINGFDKFNSVIYKSDDDYASAMKRCIEMSQEEYKQIQANLKLYTDNLYSESLKNLKSAISGGK